MQSARTHWVVNCGVVAGMVLSLALIGVSALLNFRMAYRMGDTELDAWIYGGGAACADGLKALLPFFIAWAMYKREYLAVAAASVLFAVMTAYSFSAGMGFAAQLRSYQEEARLGAIAKWDGYRKEIDGLEAQLASAGTGASSREIRAQIAQVFARKLGRKTTVGEYSKKCTLTRRWSRESCEEVAGLRSALAGAERRETMRTRLAELRRELRQSGAKGASGRVDPQVEALAGLLTVETEQVRLSLLVLVGLLFELSSGIGLYVATVPWRARRARKGDLQELEYVAEAKRVGDVEEFAVQRVNPALGRTVTSSDLFASYRRWCGKGGEAPMSELEFYNRFEAIAKELKLAVRQRSGRLEYVDVAAS